MRNVTWTTLIGLVLVVTLVACSTGGGTGSAGDSGNDAGDTDGTTTSSGIAAAAAFPRTLAITSPAATAGATASSFGVQQTANPGEEEERRVLTYEEVVSSIDTILDVEADFSLSTDFDPQMLVAASGDANCYGPAVVYQAHPDWPEGATIVKREMPVGDLGFWYDTNDDTSEACAAAQLNARIEGVQSRAVGAMAFTAILLRVADGAGIEAPAIGSEIDITDAFNTALEDAGSDAPTIVEATYSQDTADTVSYVLEYRDAGASSGPTNSIELTHREVSDEVYQGFLYYRTEVVDSNQGNCRVDGNAISNNGTLLYNVSGSDVVFESRFAGYCGTNVVADSEDGVRPKLLLDPSNASTESNVNGWGGNFEVFGAQFNSETMEGSYVYAWQAGPGDGYARTLVANISTTGDSQVGTAYFGYADDIQTYDGLVPQSVDDMSLLGMFCNWTGPSMGGPPPSPTDFTPLVGEPGPGGRDAEIRLGVQEQVMTRESAASVFTVSESNIEYAPIKPRDPDTGDTIDEMVPGDRVNAVCTVPTANGDQLELNTDPITYGGPDLDVDEIDVSVVSLTDELVAVSVYASATDSWVVAAPSNPFIAE